MGALSIGVSVLAVGVTAVVGKIVWEGLVMLIESIGCDRDEGEEE